jgi:trigger factor
MTKNPPQTSSRVEFTVSYHPNCVAELSVIASNELALEARQHAIKIVGKNKSLPGFRKGKAPDEMIVRNFPSDVDKTWQDELATFALQECLKTSAAAPLSKETRIVYHVDKHSLHDEAKLSLKFEIEPKVPEITLGSFEIKPVERPKTDETTVEETIRQTLFFFASWEEISARPVQENDCVVLDVDVIEAEPRKPLFSAARFEV